MSTQSGLSPNELKERLEQRPLWPEFDEGDTKIDGLIPTCRVENWENFLKVVQASEYNRATSEWVYRGQRGGDWPLASTLGRQFPGGNIPNEKRLELLEQFELAMRGRGNEIAGFLGEDEEIEKWAIGQHNGLLTPLLDWTRSPFVALFFAFNTLDEPEENPSRAIFCVNMSAIKAAIGEEIFWEPKGHNNSRLVSQAGLFSLVPNGDDNFITYIINALMEAKVVIADTVTLADHIQDSSGGFDEVEYTVSDSLSDQLKKYIHKIHIPNADRLNGLAMLRKMNIHSGSMFPDAQGASLYCNNWLERVLVEEKIDQEKAKKREEERKAAAAVMAELEANELESEATPEELVNDDGLVYSIFPVVNSIFGDEFTELEKQNFAERLHQRYLQDRSIDWQKTDSKIAKIKIGQRRLLTAFGISEAEKESVVDKLLELYHSQA